MVYTGWSDVAMKFVGSAVMAFLTTRLARVHVTAGRADN